MLSLPEYPALNSFQDAKRNLDRPRPKPNKKTAESVLLEFKPSSTVTEAGYVSRIPKTKIKQILITTVHISIS